MTLDELLAWPDVSRTELTEAEARQLLADACTELQRLRGLFLSAVSMLETPDAWCTACGRPRHRLPKERADYVLGHEDDCPRGAIEREAERLRALVIAP